MTRTVYNLSTGKEITYTNSWTAEQAVIAAHFQSHGDYNTWDLPRVFEKFADLVCRGKLSVSFGDWATANYPEQ